MFTGKSFNSLQYHILALVRVEGLRNKWATDLERALGVGHDRKKIFINSHYLLSSGPIFTEFIAADLQTLEGFMKFTERIGFDWIATIAPSEPREKPLVEYLEQEFNVVSPGRLGPTIPTIMESKEKREVPRYLMEKYYFYLTSQEFLKKKHEEISVHESIKNRGENVLVQQQALMKRASEIAFSYEERSAEPVKEQFMLHTGLVREHAERLGFLKNEIMWHLGILNDKQEEAIKWRLEITSGKFHLRREPLTLLALCWLEIMQIINSEMKLIKCANCGRYFAPSRKNARYCKRLVTDMPVHLRRTCKDVGAQKEYKQSLKEDKKKKESRSKYMKVYTKMYRAKKKHGENSREHRSALALLKKLKNDNGGVDKKGRENG